MTNIELTSIIGKDMYFEVSIDGISEKGSIELDKETLHGVQDILAERPFKAKLNEIYSWSILGGIENNKNSEKELTIEIHRGKSRVRRSCIVSKKVFLKFWNIIHYQKLPSELGSEQRVH